MKNRGALVLIALLLGACRPNMDKAEVTEMLIKPTRGLIGGIELGDSWDKVKAEHDARYTVVEAEKFFQLRRDLPHPLRYPSEGHHLLFKVDTERKITGINVSIDGESKNALVVRQLVDDFIAHFDAKVGDGSCADGTCDWPSKSGGPSVHLVYYTNHNPLRFSIDIDIPAATEN